MILHTLSFTVFFFSLLKAACLAALPAILLTAFLAAVYKPPKVSLGIKLLAAASKLLCPVKRISAGILTSIAY